MDEVLFNYKANKFGVRIEEDKKKVITLVLTHMDVNGILLLESASKVGKHIRLVNKLNKIYVIINKDKCKNWKVDLMMLIDNYNAGENNEKK